MIVQTPQIKSRGAQFELVRQEVLETLQTGGEVVAPRGVALWRYTFPLVAQGYSTAQAWFGALAKLTRMGNVFDAMPPGFDAPQYVKDNYDSGWTQGEPTITDLTQTGNSVTVDGLVPDVLFLERGDYIQFTTSEGIELKVCTQDAQADNSGEAVVTFEPELRLSPLSVEVVEPKARFRLASPDFSYQLQPNRITSITVDAIESYDYDT